MASAPDLLTQYGLAVIFVWAFAVQAGAPAPAVPMLLGAGALSGTGRMNLAAAIGAAMAATVVADVVWYWLARAHGTRVLELLCRFSLDPDSPRLGWYAGVAVLAIVDISEWPLAIVMMVGHEVAHRTHREAVRDFAEASGAFFGPLWRSLPIS